MGVVLHFPNLTISPVYTVLFPSDIWVWGRISYLKSCHKYQECSIILLFRKNISIILCYHLPDTTNNNMIKCGSGFSASVCIISSTIFALVLMICWFQVGEVYRKYFYQEYDYTATAVTSGFAFMIWSIRSLIKSRVTI